MRSANFGAEEFAVGGPMMADVDRQFSIGWKGAKQAASIQGRHVATPTMPAR